MNAKEYLKPRLVGERFEGAAIPLEVLRDIAVLEEMIVEVAKWVFKQEHPDRQRVPRGFTDGIELRLDGIEEGSAIPRIVLILATTSGCLPGLAENEQCFDLAKDRLVSAVAAAEDGGDVTDHLPPECLTYFDRVGRSLRSGEHIEFDRANQQPPARLTRESRRKLVLASRVREFTDEIIVRGSIPEADKADMTFELDIINGPKIVGPIPDQHMDVIVEAFVGYQEGKRVMVQGVGRYSRQNRLTGIDSIEHITVLDPLDVPARLDEFRPLRRGWLDGVGIPPPQEGLDWLTMQFTASYPEDAALPYAYPTEDGGILMEWSLGGVEASLDIDLVKRTGFWHLFDTVTDQTDAREFDLEDPAAWAEIGKMIRELGGGQG
ncbi:MAG: hypothetical protein K9N51_01925 [Candidatus Pacebacteria bacterium]|nr:hypothetical protein [Candidatus Paceibacterota bacterium]